MKIGKNSVVTFHYTLSNVGGEALESSDQNQPALYLHGHNNIMPALEAALEGKQAGDELSVTLEAKDAYGERRPDSVQRVPMKHLVNAPKRLRPGMAVQVNTQSGPQAATVLKVGKFNVDVDTNHPLAGMSLSFSLQVVDVREASEDEIAHGHAHGPGGHHH